jgi:hypothetical protein
LGIRAEALSFNDHAGRPIPVLNGGQVIPELVARA